MVIAAEGPAPAPDDPIRVGAISRLEVANEDVGTDGVGYDIDFSAQTGAPVRRPDLFEKFTVAAAAKLTTYLLAVRTGPGGLEVRHYFVAPHLRGGISGMRPVVVVPWWSLRDKRWHLWIVNYNPGSSWYDSLRCLLEQPPEFYRGKCFTVESVKTLARYRPRWYESDVEVPAAPGRPVGALLGEALGESNFIRDASHPVYRRLTDGEVVF
jgi:hypothetical protein